MTKTKTVKGRVDAVLLNMISRWQIGDRTTLNLKQAKRELRELVEKELSQIRWSDFNINNVLAKLKELFL